MRDIITLCLSRDGLLAPHESFLYPGFCNVDMKEFE